MLAVLVRLLLPREGRIFSVSSFDTTTVLTINTTILTVTITSDKECYMLATIIEALWSSRVLHIGCQAQLGILTACLSQALTAAFHSLTFAAAVACCYSGYCCLLLSRLELCPTSDSNLSGWQHLLYSTTALPL